MDEAMTARNLRITGHGGDEIEAYLATADSAGRTGGVVVIHHLPGWDRFSKEITRRFAAMGYNAICPNLYCREAPDAEPTEAAAISRAQGWIPDDRLLGDVQGAADYLRSCANSNGKVGVIGYCSGGRHAFLAGIGLKIDAAVDCYGAFVVASPPESLPLPVSPLITRAEELGCPLLGLFGADDSTPTVDEVQTLENALKANGKTHDLHIYEG